MVKILRQIAVTLLTLVFLPLLGSVLLSMIQSGPLIGNTNAVIGGAAAWLSGIVGASWYLYALAGIGSFSVGIWLEWMGRQFDGSRQTRLIALAEELYDIRERLQGILDLKN